VSEIPGPPPTRNPARSHSSARHATRQAAGLAQARRSWEALGAHAQPVPAVRTCTPAQTARRRRATWRSSRVRCTCGAETVRWGARAQCASRQPPTSLARSGQPLGVVGALWCVVGVGGGGRTKAARWWRRICEAAVRARCEQGRGWVSTLWGAVETGGRRMKE